MGGADQESDTNDTIADWREKPVLAVRDSEETLEMWSRSEALSPKLRNSLSQANALIVPFVGYGEREDVRYFPEGTEELLHALRSRAGEKLIADICVDDEDYQELDLHADELRMAKIVFDYVVWPIVVNVLHDLAKRWRSARTSRLRVKSKIVVTRTPSGRSVEIEYDGPASVYGDSLRRALEGIGEKGEGTRPEHDETPGD